jgi:hypothetical protein
MIAVLGPIALFALIWWGWLTLRLPPDDPGGRLAAALGAGGAVAVPVGAFLAWWATRADNDPQHKPPASGASQSVTASGERSIATGQGGSGISSTGDHTINIQPR